MQQILTCFSPALFPHYLTENSIAVIIDVFRATTSICTAFQNGAASVRTVASTAEAMDWQAKGRLVAAERNTQKCDFADFGNSPFDFTAEKVSGKEIVFTTTNGTRSVEAAFESDEIVIGAFSNISQLTEYCLSKKKNIIMVCSGWNNRFCHEDTLFAGALAERLMAEGDFEVSCDASMAAIDLWKIAKGDLKNYLTRSEHYKRLERNGLDHEVDYCLTDDLAPVLPIMNKEKKIFTLK